MDEWSMDFSSPDASRRAAESDIADDDRLLVVGVGASAGGLEALTEFLQHLSPSRELAVVVIQHLDPRHESVLPELLSVKTPMDVSLALDATPIEGRHVYVIAPNAVLRVHQGRFAVEERQPGSFKPIDSFLFSLAEAYGNRAIGIVLSGSATDGTLGLKRIKAEGGITFAQDQTAKFESMPRSAIAAGAVDFVLAPRDIAEEVSALAGQRGKLKVREPGDGAAMNRLLLLLRKSCGVDFKQYKQPTIGRRLQRRMVVRKIESLEEYLRLVQQEPAELEALFDDLLINVTDFFRDPEVFEVAKRLAFPSILQHRRSPHTIRAWIPGCSTGEEVYSLAIALAEFLEAQEFGCSIQIFGTDVSERTIDTARKGIYNDSAVMNVSPERLRRFFVRTGSGYQISRTIREMCIFSRHNVAQDPPLSRMDVISCRNLLIYFSPLLQKKVIGTFSYSLQPTGCLILGPSESLGSLADHFSVLDEQRKLYSRTTTIAPQPFEFGDERPDPPSRRVFGLGPVEPPSTGIQLQRYADQIVLSRYAPAGVVVDEALRIKSYRGRIDEYLVSSGQEEDGTELMSRVRPSLRAPVSAAIERARRTDSVAVEWGPAIAEGARPITITVIPISLAGHVMHYLVMLERGENTPASLADNRGEGASGRVEVNGGQDAGKLAEELKSTREYLQSVIEELRSTNEEVQSANEELQSTNEEMQTSKEELQSSNEELQTINAELQCRNAELALSNDDLLNLLGSMNMPIVMTGRDLRIRRFTALAEKLLRLIPTDVGRPIADLKPRIKVPDLEEILRGVLDTLQPFEREVEDYEGRSYVMRVRPYRTGDDRIDGTVLQLLDVSEIKRSLDKAKHARYYAETIVNTIREPLVVLDERLMVRNANPAFHEALQLEEGAAAGKPIAEASLGRFDTPSLHGLFERLRQGANELIDEEVEAKSGAGELRTLLVNARRLRSPEGEQLILLAFQDITERKRAAEARFRRLFESARDGIVIVDAASGEILDVNPFTEQLLGYRREEVVGQKLWEVEAIAAIPNLRSAAEQIRERGVMRFDSLLARTRDGGEIDVEVIASVYYEGKRALIQLNMRDVGERKKFERELQESQKLESLGLLAGGIAHDFNNLLTGILGNASLALSDTTPDEPMRQRLRQIVNASERAAFLTRQMLAYAGRGQFVTALIDLGELTREIVPMVRSSIPIGVDLKLDLAPHLPRLKGDPAQIQQVLMNLVINAVEAIGENAPGRVTVRTSLREVSVREVAELFKSEPAQPGGYLQLEVIDTGAGMDEQTRARMFDPFFTTKFTGRGLGLAAVQGIVRRHGGVIFVHSAPGQGTTVRILFPASDLDAEATGTQATRAAEIPPGTVALVIDDEQTVLEVAVSILTRKGIKVLVAEDGRKGVEVFRAHREIVSLILLDMQMPVMGGEEAMPLLREIDPDVPIILTSGFDESEITRRVASPKPARFLQKPFTAQRLIAAVAGVLQGR